LLFLTNVIYYLRPGRVQGEFGRGRLITLDLREQVAWQQGRTPSQEKTMGSRTAYQVGACSFFEQLERRLLLSTISGHIATDTLLEDTTEPYVLDGNLYVDPGATLSLLPGVTLRTENSSWDIFVQGRLEATDAVIDLAYYHFDDSTAFSDIHKLSTGSVRARLPTASPASDTVQPHRPPAAPSAGARGGVSGKAKLICPPRT